MNHSSPESMTESTVFSCSQSEAVFSQSNKAAEAASPQPEAWRTNEPTMEHLESVLLHPGLDQPIPKPPDEGGPPRCLYDIVSPSFTLSTIKHSPKLSDGLMLPIVVSRQCDLNIVSKTSGVYGIHSPSLETARKQSITSIVPSSIEGEGQLVRACAYIQERIKCHSFASNEFPHYSSKVPPDKPVDVVSKEMKAGKMCALPVYRSEGAVETDRCPNECLIETEEVLQTC